MKNYIPTTSMMLIIGYTSSCLINSNSIMAFHISNYNNNNNQRRRTTTTSSISSSMNNYLSSLSTTVMESTYNIPHPPSETTLPTSLNGINGGDSSSSSSNTDDITFTHKPLSYFDIDKLTVKGPRANADVGTPYDSTRGLDDLSTLSSGSWWCSAGGWPSPKLRDTTEIFYVISGFGCLTDLDSTKHFFGPGDTVILPKGWSGRWDVLEDIHKVWFVHEHDNIEITTTPIRAIIKHYHQLSKTLYNIGPTKVHTWITSEKVIHVPTPTSHDEGFHVLEGIFYITNGKDGSAQRCVAGDTVVIPKGWTGQYDIIEPVKALQVIV